MVHSSLKVLVIIFIYVEVRGQIVRSHLPCGSGDIIQAIRLGGLCTESSQQARYWHLKWRALGMVVTYHPASIDFWVSHII